MVQERVFKERGERLTNFKRRVRGGGERTFGEICSNPCSRENFVRFSSRYDAISIGSVDFLRRFDRFRSRAKDYREKYWEAGNRSPTTRRRRRTRTTTTTKRGKAKLKLGGGGLVNLFITRLDPLSSPFFQFQLFNSFINSLTNVRRRFFLKYFSHSLSIRNSNYSRRINFFFFPFNSKI